jgi:hypothetical protein
LLCLRVMKAISVWLVATTLIACDLASNESSGGGDDDDDVSDDDGRDEGDDGEVENDGLEGDESGPEDSAVTINDRAATADEVARLEALLLTEIPPGDYWYDAVSGLGGPWGMQSVVYAPGLDFGPVPANASAGDTAVFYNGRELPRVEAEFVAWLYDIPADQIPLFAGRYVLQSTGDLFGEDGTYLGNLAALAASKGGGGSGDCTAVTIPSSAPNPTGVPQTIDVATGTGC